MLRHWPRDTGIFVVPRYLCATELHQFGPVLHGRLARFVLVNTMKNATTPKVNTVCSACNLFVFFFHLLAFFCVAYLFVSNQISIIQLKFTHVTHKHMRNVRELLLFLLLSHRFFSICVSFACCCRLFIIIRTILCWCIFHVSTIGQ